MAVFKCKMCGGGLDPMPGASVGSCPYCGGLMTLPRLNDDRRANLYERAGNLRRANDYDRAAAVYETILSEDPADAEAYWSLVLCRYGVEYVEDHKTRKRLPTCNRTQPDSVFADADYKQAITHADAYARSLYEEEARAIDAVQKGILELSLREEPFDVFICCKEKDDLGGRTPDSVLAQDIYEQLTKNGFRVFFARLSLEDRLGENYEPYIFAALSSARVMLALGTKPEHFQAVWVRNEWSRYLGRIKSGAAKTLIPVFRDMDPEGLPEEMSRLQAQDMGKLGAMQDLLRGVEKIAAPRKPRASAGGRGLEIRGGRGLVLHKGQILHPEELTLDIDEEARVVRGLGGGEGNFLNIPEGIVGIAPGAFRDRAGIEILNLGDSVASIGEEAFAGTGLKFLSLPERVKNISRRAFAGCPLEQVFLGQGARTIDEGAFENCAGLRKAQINSGLKRLGKRAFAGCLSLRNLEFDSLKNIGEGAFAGCGSLESVTLPGGLSSVAPDAFEGCLKLRNINLGGRTVGASAAWGDIRFASPNLRLGLLPEVENIEAGAFAGCSFLTSLSLPDSLKSIGEKAFTGCSGLRSLLLPEYLESIGESAFAGCSSLREIKLFSDRLRSVGEKAFAGCDCLEKITLSGASAAYPFSKLGLNPEKSSVHLENLPGEGFFEGCADLTQVFFINNNRNYYDLEIGKRAFKGCSGLNHIILPKYLEKIKESAFEDCTGLESVSIPSKVRRIEGRAFAGCSGLRKLTFTGKRDSAPLILDSEAFADCLSLSEVNFPGNMERTDCDFPEVFRNTPALNRAKEGKCFYCGGRIDASIGECAQCGKSGFDLNVNNEEYFFSTVNQEQNKEYEECAYTNAIKEKSKSRLKLIVYVFIPLLSSIIIFLAMVYLNLRV
jgi:hypothetical protein